ncbi:MAG: hypothetical protein E7623_05475 [Ruminococcaceae bacterium]|nr:hypothetical protein [Oscillospiraceae bacterium]
MKNIKIVLSLLLLLAAILSACSASPVIKETESEKLPSVYEEKFVPIDPESLPSYSGEPYVTVNGNSPSFTKKELRTDSYEYYSELDALGRCGICIAVISTDIMPTEERGSIGSVKPTGWQISKYDNVDGKYLYNRCHLIGYQLTGENANTKNLITGTRYMNVDGMLPFENMVADYVKETGNHVAYRVTPIFVGSELVARGVQIEAYSVEDEGDGICFNVFCYNVQPDIEIDYKTGDNRYSPAETESAEENVKKCNYVLNKNSKKFHYPSCESVGKMSEKNKEERNTDRGSLISEGYDPCGICKP